MTTQHEALIDGLRQHAISLATVEAGHDFADLQPLAEIIGDARVVALGEATHGTREFFQLKHRLLEFLVVELGFTAFAIEANWSEALTVNDYVLHDRGDPAAALTGLYFWTWDTYEVLDLILWMRNYNADPVNDTKITFHGIDAQFTPAANAAVQSFLGRVDPNFSTEVAPILVPLEELYLDYTLLAPAIVDGLSRTVREIDDRLRAYELDYVARSSPEEWRLTCQHARVLRHADELHRAHGDAGTRYALRDWAMAETIAWILETEGPNAKVVVWAHNGHVARDPFGLFADAARPMGMHLASRFGSALIVVGFTFGQGSFQALVPHGPSTLVVAEATVGTPPDGSLDATLEQVGVPAFVLDLRQLDDDLRPWFEEPRVTREVGGIFEGEKAMQMEIIPATRYDALVFIAQTTRARPTPTGQRTIGWPQ